MERFWKKSIFIFSSELIFFIFIYLIFLTSLKIVRERVSSLQEIMADQTMQISQIADLINSITTKINLAIISSLVLIFIALTLTISIQIYFWYNKKMMLKNYLMYLMKISLPSFLLVFLFVDASYRVLNNIEGLFQGNLKIFLIQLGILSLIVLLFGYFAQFLFVFLLKNKFLKSLKKLSAAIKRACIFLPFLLLFLIILTLHKVLYLTLYPSSFLIYFILTSIIISFYKVCFLRLLDLHKIL